MIPSLPGWPQTSVSEPVQLTWYDAPAKFTDDVVWVAFEHEGRLLSMIRMNYLERLGFAYYRALLAEPVCVVLWANAREEGAVVRGELFAAVPDAFGEVEERLLPLGSVARLPEERRYPGDPERESRDFMISLLQGCPQERVEELLKEVSS